MFQRLSDHLWLVTLGGDNKAQGPEKVLQIRAKATFPPSHPTTRLCLDLLREIFLPDSVKKLLDVGCGSGVLGLAAAALGVPLVVSLDIAPRAAWTTWDNARDNHLDGSIQVIQGSTECVLGCFDLVMANLPWEVQVDKAPEFNRLTSPHGCLILSGFHDNQERLLLENYRRLGWLLGRRITKDFHHPELPPDMSFTWVAWALKRNG